MAMGRDRGMLVEFEHGECEVKDVGGNPKFFLHMRNKLKSKTHICLLYTSPSPRDRTRSRMPSSA